MAACVGAAGCATCSGPARVGRSVSWAPARFRGPARSSRALLGSVLTNPFPVLLIASLPAHSTRRDSATRWRRWATPSQTIPHCVALSVDCFPEISCADAVRGRGLRKRLALRSTFTARPSRDVPTARPCRQHVAVAPFSETAAAWGRGPGAAAGAGAFLKTFQMRNRDVNLKTFGPKDRTSCLY